MRKLFTIIIMLAAILTANAQGNKQGTAQAKNKTTAQAKNKAIKNEYQTLKDISYISADDTSSYRRERCKLDMYLPTQKKGFKTIVWFHGGGLEGGNKEFRPELMNSGFAQVAPNYRFRVANAPTTPATLRLP